MIINKIPSSAVSKTSIEGSNTTVSWTNYTYTGNEQSILSTLSVACNGIALILNRDYIVTGAIAETTAGTFNNRSGNIELYNFPITQPLTEYPVISMEFGATEPITALNLVFTGSQAGYVNPASIVIQQDGKAKLTQQVYMSSSGIIIYEKGGSYAYSWETQNTCGNISIIINQKAQ